ncbi:MAG: hypothetical protein JJ894_03240 [Dinoroseobacter sp.]|nr:hypothetical protein [Dinoroseobacter sp.]
MGVDWGNVAARVAALGAPVLGGALGGPLGAGVGRLAGQIVGSALGVEDQPDLVLDALDLLDPTEATAALQAAEHAHREQILRLQLQAETNDLEQVNETMRAELVHGNWYQKGWRPTFGYITAVSYGAVLLAIAKVLWTNGDPALLGALASVTMIFGIGLSVLGVTSYRRSTDKQTLAGVQQTGGLMDALASRIRREAT